MVKVTSVLTVAESASGFSFKSGLHEIVHKSNVFKVVSSEKC